MTNIIDISGKQIISDKKRKELEAKNKSFTDGYNYHRNQTVEVLDKLQNRFRRNVEKSKDEQTKHDAQVFLSLLTELKTVIMANKHNENTQ